MRIATLITVFAVPIVAGCNAATAPGYTTGLVGDVTRGPVTPVCMPDVPCDAPFSAGFSVTSGGHVVATFHSDAQGHFEVRLPPGDYTIVPGHDAPIISPADQVKAVVVGADGLTTAHLDFDTGLR